VRAHLTGEGVDALLDACTANGITVRSLTTGPPGLEDAYLDATGELRA
jgi:hypothetical protein